MPEPVADGKKPAPVVIGEGLVVLIQVRDVGEGGRQAVFVGRPQAGADGLLQLAEAAAEGKLLLVGEILVVEDQHRVFVHPPMNSGDLLRA